MTRTVYDQLREVMAQRDALQIAFDGLQARWRRDYDAWNRTPERAEISALQARIDAAQPIFDAVRALLANIALTGTYSRRGYVKALNDLAAAGAALGVDPQKDAS